jgi:hypothetical protein
MDKMAAVEMIKLLHSLFDSQVVGFVKLINRGVEKGSSQSALLSHGKGKSGIGTRFSDVPSPAISGGGGVHVPIEDPESRVGILSIDGLESG